MREFFTRGMSVGKNNRTSGYLGYGIATALDQIRAHQPESAEATLCVLMVAIEQSALDQSRWQLAWLLTHLPEPPWHQMAHGPQGGGMRPFGRLADPACTGAAMAFVKDASAVEEVRKRFDGKGAGKGQRQDKDE